MDEADRAERQEQMARDAALKVRRPVPSVEANGECHHCGDIVPDGVRWCDAGCRDGWERRKK